MGRYSIIYSDFKYKKLIHILEPLCEEGEKIYFAHLGLVFTLLRYPMPTKIELNRFKEALETVETREDFEVLICWLDEYDEIDLGDIHRDTPFVTSQTKAMIYWLFSYADGGFNKTALLHFLERYVSPQPLARWFHDFISFGF